MIGFCNLLGGVAGGVMTAFKHASSSPWAGLGYFIDFIDGFISRNF